MISPTIQLLKSLIECPSVTPDDAGCQTLISKHLTAAGFQVQSLPAEGVTNLWATHGSGKPLIVFQGHTDVVPPGPESAWNTPPFTATVQDGCIYGRGAADMKSGVAAMVIAAIEFCKKNSNHQGTIAIALTSDEEGPATHGMAHLTQYLRDQQICVDFCVTGEPTSVESLGDMLKIGRRGSLHGTLTIHGKQGHIAYPHLAINPIHNAMPIIQELAATTWDEGFEHFPPTSLQFYDMQSGTGASNVIPGALTARFNFRYSPAHTAASLQTQTEEIINQFALPYELKWNLSAEPFLCPGSRLVDAACDAIRRHTDVEPQVSTTGGTSDSRFFAPLGCEVIDLGPINRSAHQVDEVVSIKDTEQLTNIYSDIITTILAS